MVIELVDDDMGERRWYPTLVSMGDGRAVASSGIAAPNEAFHPATHPAAQCSRNGARGYGAVLPPSVSTKQVPRPGSLLTSMAPPSTR